MVFVAVAVAFLFAAAGRALAQDRWLLIFENSSAMKKRMPAVELELKRLFFTGLDGQIRGGDSLGVWTFDKTLHVGEFPLSTWQPERAALTASNLVTFLNKRSFRGDVNFNALQPLLNDVVEGSQRLTVLIFCEGQGDILWSPYNEAINQSLRQNYPERKKNSQPFIVLLRVQDGKYIGCSVNFPPGGLNLPAFPPLPEEIKPVVPVLPARVPDTIVGEPPRKKVPLDNSPLIIVGKNVVTNLADLPAALANLQTNPPLVPGKSGATNAMSPTNAFAGSETASITNTPTQAAAVGAVARAAAPPAAGLSAEVPGYRWLIVTGAAALLLALVLGIVLVVQARQPRGSLITDSLNTPRVPPRKP